MSCFIQSPHKKWTTLEQNSYYIGAPNIAQNLLQVMEQNLSKEKLIPEITTTLQNLKDYTSGFIETAQYILAWVDHIHAWPLLYCARGNEISISPHAKTLAQKENLDAVNNAATLELAMAGFITGRDTIYNNLNAIRPGEFILWDKNTKNLSTYRHHIYAPQPNETAPLQDNLKKLGDILDALTQKIIARANGKTIWLPLSAGLDSRIILCKLHEHSYRNIQSFTYGPAFNFEALHAKKIAKRLNIPWRMISPSSKFIRESFHSDARKKFWNFADGLKTIPCMREFSAIHYLHENKIAQAGDIFINGQSGDFITGGHIPAAWCAAGETTRDEFFDIIINKNYDLWRFLKTPENLEDIKIAIQKIIDTPMPAHAENSFWAAAHETWEYEGRQVSYVVNGQRIYEYFNYNWEMPLWEKELVDFCQNLPLNQKKNQALYKAYLRDYNYRGLFPAKEPHLWRWPIPMLWVVPAAQIIGALKGRPAKNNFYARMLYSGHYANQYNFFSKKFYLQHYKDARNIVSFFSFTWLKEHNIKITKK